MASSTDTDGITARWELEGRPMIRVLEAETRVYLHHFIQTDAMMPPHTTLLFNRALAPALRWQSRVGAAMIPLPGKPGATVTTCVLFRDIRLASLDMDRVSQQPWNRTVTTIRDAVSAWTRGRELDGIDFNGDPETRIGIFCPKFCLKVLPATAH